MTCFPATLNKWPAAHAVPSGLRYAGEPPMDRRCWKHSRQNTGRPCVGRKGTVVSLPHCEQVVRVSTRANVVVGAGMDPSMVARLALQGLQRLGSFLNCLSWKNNCSPAVKTNSAPQSMHFNALSWNSMETLPFELVPARIPSGGETAHFCARPAVPLPSPGGRANPSRNCYRLYRTPE